ncbi:MAG: hypothetical protein AAF236_13290, partial [Verrucomicrobiota bacterium]
MDPDYNPARLQLALDYLRLGEVEKAWPLAEAAADADPYNVLAFNLTVLQDEMESFAALTSPDFEIRMPREELEIYGQEALQLLTDAKKVLTEKYGVTIEEPTLVEFYPNQQDFAIRSFGSLGGEGLLGVCFGSVVTMNSPGSRTAGKNNWKATLWHEYAHVVTLTATRQKMPRWLSEGISVYEEKLHQSNWGQTMTPRYRRRILEEGKITPIAEMSQAFFEAENGEDVMFAYYQSMLVVEFLVENFGEEALRGILTDLADGHLINDAIERRTRPMAELEGEFAFYASDVATRYGEDVDWYQPEPEEVNPRSNLAVAAFLEANPRNFWARQTLTVDHLNRERWDEAISSADELINLLPEYTESANGYILKARALRAKGEFTAETAVLEKLAELSAEAYLTYQRLIEVNFEREAWAAVLTNSERSLAINPFTVSTHWCRGCALVAEGREAEAVTAFERTLALSPPNPSEVRVRLGGLLKEESPDEARRHVLDALADSPRYRDGHTLLLELVRNQ